jgi:hypothetical protein
MAQGLSQMNEQSVTAANDKAVLFSTYEYLQFFSLGKL